MALKYSRLYLASLLIIFYFPLSDASALTLNEAIELATANSTEIQIEEKKYELTSISKADAATMFLPNVSAGYHKGDRKTTISGVDNKLKEDTRTISVNQPIFNGFQGISRVRESFYKTDAAKEELSSKKNDIAFGVAESYINILKLRKIVAIENQEIIDYKRILELAKQKLLLKDISYSEYSEYEAKNQNIILSAEENKSRLIEYEIRFENLVKQKADDLTKPIIHSNLENFDEILNLAKSDNPKIKSTKHTLNATKAAVLAEKGKFLPKASLLLQRENQKSSYYFNGSSVNNDVIYLEVSIPIFQAGTEYSGVVKANKQRQIAELENKIAMEEAEKVIKEEYGKFISLKQSLLTFGEVLKNSFESLKLIEDRFKKKDIGQMELLLKKIDVAEIEKQTMAVECDMLNSYFKLKAITNDIL